MPGKVPSIGVASAGGEAKPKSDSAIAAMDGGNDGGRQSQQNGCGIAHRNNACERSVDSADGGEID